MSGVSRMERVHARQCTLAPMLFLRRSPAVQSLSLTVGLALSACHGSSGSTTPGGDESEAPPADLLQAPAGSYVSVIAHEDAPYLFVSFAMVYEGSEPPTPAGPAPAIVQLLTPTGPCDAQVGEPVSLSTGACETSTTIARPLSGCVGAFARVARVNGSWPEGARYVPLIEPTDEPFTNPAALQDAQHRARVEAWMSEEAVSGRPLQQAVSAHAIVDAGAERLETSSASFLVGASDAQCEQQVEHRTASALRRGERVIPIEGLEQWQGVVTYRGRVAGVLYRAPHLSALASVSPDGSLREEWSERVWSDNEECGPFWWAHIEYPCGP